MPLMQATPVELAGMLKEMGQPAFRSGQVFGWLHRGVPVAEMTNLPGSLKDWMTGQRLGGATIRDCRKACDGTRKYLFQLEDENLVEGVLMHYYHGSTLCISTQVGCRMGCVFCASTIDGRIRNLMAHEMLGQVVAVNRELGGGLGQQRKITNIVMMGSGEPLDNYDECIRFLGLVNEPGGLTISSRNISLSTCGLVPGIYRLMESGYPVTLSISLHAPNDEVRKQLMPIANTYPITQVLEACKAYANKTGRRFIVEYALVSGINDAPEQAKELAHMLRGMMCHVNLIGLNPVDESPLTGSSRQRIQLFLQTLIDENISATLRREMGSDIEGACGQLRRRVMEGSDVR